MSKNTIHRNRTLISLIGLSIALLSIAGCKKNDNIDISKLINKNQIGESTIQNMSKYSAIGVSDLGSKQKQKQNRLLDRTADEINDDENFTYSLVGLTVDGIVEELDLLTSGGENIKSSSLNITYYEECGDFVFFSSLPMSTNDFADLVIQTYQRLFGMADDVIQDSLRTAEGEVYGPIRELNYPLIYSFRYYDSKTKEYEYIDTSYLIHKPSGKIFPCSCHTQYIDTKSLDHGNWFRFPNGGLNEDEIASNAQTLGDVFFSNLWFGSFGGRHVVNNFDRVNVFIRKTLKNFDNGFCTGFLSGDYTNECFGVGIREGLIVEFNEGTNNLEVQQFEGVSFVGSDKFGNLLATKDGESFIYKKTTGTFVSAENKVLDAFTKRFISLSDDNSKIIFYDADLNPEKTAENKIIYGFDTFVILMPHNQLPGRCVRLDFDKGVFLLDNYVYQMEYEETANSITFSVTRLQEFEMDHNIQDYDQFFIYDSLFVFIEGSLYRIDLKGDYDLEIIDFGSQYTIKEVFVAWNGPCLAFRGIENNTLADVEGYITENGTITFDVKEMQRTISVFSPIN